MWIRNQSKRLLINVDVISVHISVHDDCDDYLIRGGGYELGRYSSKEKALRVLNDIQEWYECSYDETFQMPQDDSNEEDDF